jgi:hypothetical protein
LAFLHYRGLVETRMAAADLSTDVEWAAEAVELLTALT